MFKHSWEMKISGYGSANRPCGDYHDMKRFVAFAFVAAVFFAWGVSTIRYQVFPFDLLKATARATALSPGSGTPSSNAREMFSLTTRDADVVFVGDSITRDGPWQDVFQNVAVANRGVGGETTLDISKRLDTITSTKAERALIMAGINDLYAGRSPEQIAETYFGIIKSLRASGMEVIVQSTITCTGACRYQREITVLNDLLREYADRNGLRFIDLNGSMADGGQLKGAYTSDGVHIAPKGYQQWISELRPVLGR